MNIMISNEYFFVIWQVDKNAAAPERSGPSLLSEFAALINQRQMLENVFNLLLFLL